MKFILLKKRRDKRPVKKRPVAGYGLIRYYNYSMKSEHYFLAICHGCEYVTDRQDRLIFMNTSLNNVSICLNMLETEPKTNL